MSSDAREKLTAQFRVPSISKFQLKRGRASLGERKDDGASQDHTAKVPRIQERDGNAMPEEGEDDDDDEGMAMSSVQLEKYSGNVARNVASDAEQDRINAKKAMDARLERMSLQKRAQELKDSRMQLQNGSSSSPSASSSSPAQRQQHETESAAYYLCMYRAPQTKKHKSWDNDGFLKVIGAGRCRLYDLTSKRL